MKILGFGGLEVLIPKVGHKGGICLPMSAVAEGAVIPEGWILDPMRQAYFALCQDEKRSADASPDGNAPA